MSTSSLPQRLPERDAFHVYDTTLRDGAQREGISYSVVDKLAVARLLDDYGVGFIEGGWPGALPKDTEFFARAQNELSLTHAQLVAFGATRKAGVVVTEDQQVRALLDSGAPVITLVAKSDVWHVEQALKTSLDENESMIRDTVAFLVGEGRRVFVDMEHFFDGYKHDPDYGVRLLVAAAESGADVGVLCDTNGGMLPLGIAEIVADVAARSVGDPLPRRHRQRGGQHGNRRGRGCDARAMHREWVRRAHRQCGPVPSGGEPSAEDGDRVSARGQVGGDSAYLARDRRNCEYRA